MTEAAKEARRAYIREWRRKNPDKMRRYTETHWERVALRAKTTTKTEETDNKNDCGNIEPGSR